MTRTTQTLEPQPLDVGPDVGTPSVAARLRHHWLALTVAVAVVALSAWTVLALRDNTTTTERPPVSIRQVERAEMERQGVTSYFDLPAVRRHRQQSSNRGIAAPSQREVWRMELSELHRFRNRVPASARPAVEAEIRRLDDLLGSSADK
jgi:hypothetical protein